MSHGAVFRKTEQNVKTSVPTFDRYSRASGFYDRNMARQPDFDWYLTDWMDTVGVSQADLQRETGWSKRKASDLCTGQQRFNRDSLNEAAQALKVYPFELLIHPSDAMAIRKLKEGGVTLATRSEGEFPDRPHLKVISG